MSAAEQTHQWRAEPYEFGARVCQGLHKRGADCEWEYLHPNMAPARYHGLQLAVSLSSDDLDAIESYFEDRADLDNQEMKLLNAARRVKELHAKIASSPRPRVSLKPEPGDVSRDELYGGPS